MTVPSVAHPEGWVGEIVFTITVSVDPVLFGFSLEVIERTLTAS